MVGGSAGASEGVMSSSRLLPFLVVVARKAERKAGSKEKLNELKCTEWWYQGLSQALLIKAERLVVLAWSIRVPVWDHYDESTKFRAF